MINNTARKQRDLREMCQMFRVTKGCSGGNFLVLVVFSVFFCCGDGLFFFF